MQKHQALIRLLISLTLLCSLFTVGCSTKSEVQDKYADNTTYTILTETTADQYQVFLGKDTEQHYLDIFSKGKYHGGATLPFSLLPELHDIYHFTNHAENEESLLIIYGENLEYEYSTYTVELENNTNEPIVFTKAISSEQYILDIYPLKDNETITSFVFSS